MAPHVAPTVQRLPHLLRAYTLLAVVQTVVAGSLVLPLAVHGWSVAGLLAACCTLSFAVRRFGAAREVRETARRLRLENRFMALALLPGDLRRCIERTDHLWNDSLLLGALRQLGRHPLPRLLVEAERRRHAGLFRRALAPLIPAPFDADPLLLLAAAIAWRWTDVPALGTAMLALILVLLGATILAGILHWLIRDDFGQLIESLTRWSVAAAPFEHDAAEPYAHTMLYRAQAWFAPDVPDSQGPFADDPLPPRSQERLAVALPTG